MQKYEKILNMKNDLEKYFLRMKVMSWAHQQNPVLFHIPLLAKKTVSNILPVAPLLFETYKEAAFEDFK